MLIYRWLAENISKDADAKDADIIAHSPTHICILSESPTRVWTHSDKQLNCVPVRPPLQSMGGGRGADLVGRLAAR